MAKPDPSNPEHIATAAISPLHWGWLASRGRYKPYRHVRYLNRKIMDALADGRDLLIEMHPRAGKSLLVSRYLPGWYLGTHPDKHVLHASWKVQASEKWGRRIRKDLEADGELVFGIRLSREVRSAARFEIEGHEGGFLATGATSGVQGEPADLMVTDDLVKGHEAVRSEVQLEHLAEFCTADLETRREDGCVHISIETPWHEADPHGVWRETFPHRYETVRLPAIAGDDDPLGRAPGEALCPQRINLERLLEIRDAKPHLWNALYMCRPQDPAGGIWKRKWWREPDRTFHLEQINGERWLLLFDGFRVPLANCVRFVVVDLATSTRSSADYTVIGSFALTNERPRRLAILEILRVRLEAPEINPRVRLALDRWGARVAYYETRGNQLWGAAFAKRAGIPARSIGSAKDCDVRISGDKVTVAHEATPLAAAGRLLIPKTAPWVADWEHEMLVFPMGKTDDQCDVTAWACHIAHGFDRFSLLTPSSRSSREVDDEPQDRWVEEWESRHRRRRQESARELRPTRFRIEGVPLEEGPNPP